MKYPFLLEILIGDVFGEIRDIVLLFDPVFFGLSSIRIVIFEAESLGQGG